MCPVCLTTAVLIATSVTSSGGLAAIAIGRSKVSQKRNRVGEIVTSLNQRRNQDVNERDSESESRVAR
jgi:hypothetical protein